jgi:serpin B
MKRFVSGLSFVLLTAVTARAADVPAERSALVKGNTRFALELYQKLRVQEGNLFLSPYSISSALAMTYGGARGQTAEEMARTLHFDLANDKLHPAFAALTKEINGEGNPKRGYQLRTANALWGQKGYPFQADFIKLNKDNYGAGLNEVDFKDATEEARQTINTWVEKQTEDKIKELLQKGVLKPNARMVLTNAIYFKGDWASQFKKDLTRPGDFNLGGGATVKAPLMHQKATFKYLDGGRFQALEMPYVGKDLTMVVLLPKKVDGLAEFEKGVTPETLAAWLGQLRPTEVNVTLPKFKVTAEFALNDALSALGMPSAFKESVADFSGITTADALFIAAVVHKAFVDVNEEGTEAAAATAVIVVEPTAVRVIPEFRADHPFLFLIRDTRSDTILFMGRLAEPK